MSKTLAQKIISAPNGYTDESREVAEAYLKLLNPWISVEDRLPEEGANIDVWIKHCNYAYRITDGEFLNRVFNECIIDHQGDFSHYQPIKYVTHWMAIKHPLK